MTMSTQLTQEDGHSSQLSCGCGLPHQKMDGSGKPMLSSMGWAVRERGSKGGRATQWNRVSSIDQRSGNCTECFFFVNKTDRYICNACDALGDAKWRLAAQEEESKCEGTARLSLTWQCLSVCATLELSKLMALQNKNKHVCSVWAAPNEIRTK